MRFAQPGWLWLMILMPLPWLLERQGRGSPGPVSTASRPSVASAGSGFAGCRPCWAGWRSAPGRRAGTPADRRRRDPDRRAGGRDRRRSRPELEHEHPRFPDRPGHEEGSRAWRPPRRRSRSLSTGRPDDLIGLVVFANYPDLACPAILDHTFLIGSRGESAHRRCPATTEPTSALRSPSVSMPCWLHRRRRRCSSS